jgi:hypothetical protein
MDLGSQKAVALLLNVVVDDAACLLLEHLQPVDAHIVLPAHKTHGTTTIPTTQLQAKSQVYQEGSQMKRMKTK